MSDSFKPGERLSAAKLNRLIAARPASGGVLRPTVVQVSAATHEPGPGVDWRYFVCTNASGCAVTVPADETTDFPIGTLLTYEQGNTGVITVTGADYGLDSQVAINLRSVKAAATGARYSVIFLIKKAANTWTLYGDLADA